MSTNVKKKESDDSELKTNRISKSENANYFDQSMFNRFIKDIENDQDAFDVDTDSESNQNYKISRSEISNTLGSDENDSESQVLTIEPLKTHFSSNSTIFGIDSDEPS